MTIYDWAAMVILLVCLLVGSFLGFCAWYWWPGRDRTP